MAVAAAKSPNDQKKIIMAIALGVAAVVALWWTFFGFGGSSTTPPSQPTRAAAKASPLPVGTAGQTGPGGSNTVTPADLSVIPISWTPPQVPEPQRNIFAFYVPPVKPSPTPTPTLPPSPTPTPPILLASVSPSNVYARTDDFTLEVTGDRFTSAVHLVMDNRDLTTRYISPQQLSATVPAIMISNPGPRQVIVRSSDGNAYSNSATVNVAAPPVPNYTYIGIIAKTNRIGDTAMLLNKSTKEVLSQQRGDIVDGRFRITSIAEGELVLVDTNLKIKHTLPLTVEGG